MKLNDLEKRKFSISEMMIIFFYSLFCYGYFGRLDNNKFLICEIFIAIILVFVFFRNVSLSKPNLLWIIVFIYIIINAYSCNISVGMDYLIIYLAGMLMLMIKKDTMYYEKLLNVFLGISITFAVFTFINAIFPGVIAKLFGFLVPSNYFFEINEHINSGGGLAGEVSYNAFCLSIGIAISIGRYFSSEKKKFRYILYMIILYIAVLLTDKRSFMLLIPCIFLIIWMILSLRRKKSTMCILGLFILAIIPALYEFFLRNLLWKILGDGNAGISLTGRSEYMWSIAYKMINLNPVFGNGINTFDVFFNNYYSHVGFVGAHNSYLQITAELGYLGVILYFSAVIYCLTITLTTYFMAIKKNNELECFLCCSSFAMQLVCLFYGLTGNPFHQQQQLLAYFIFISITIQIRKKQNT